ncbi:MAG: protein kinase [Myxococcota bacterium]
MAEDSMVGQEIGSYRLETLLGAGGMARVYRARHKVLGRVYALKVLIERSKPGNQERFEREAKIIAQLDHPNVVGVHDFGFTPEGRPYLVMEWVDGRNLAELIDQEGPFSPQRSAMLARQIASALVAIHGLGFVHRDLKPVNIMVRRDKDGQERASLLDFGLARAADPHRDGGERLTLAGHVVGTPHYIAPEVMRSAAAPDARADLYALGVTLYAMLARRRPFSGATAVELLISQERDVPQPIPGSRGLDQIACAMLKPEPTQRTPTAQAVIDALDALDLEGEEPITRPQSPAIDEPPPPLRTISYPEAPDPTALPTEPGVVLSEAEPPPVETVTAPLAVAPTLPLGPSPLASVIRAEHAGRPWIGPAVAVLGGVLLLGAIGLGALRGRAPTVLEVPSPTPTAIRAEATPSPMAVRALVANPEPTPASPAPVSSAPMSPPASPIRSAAPRPSASPSARKVSASEIAARANEALHAQGWTRAEAQKLETLQGPLAALDAAVKAEDVERATTAAEEVRRLVPGADPAGRVLKDRLDRIQDTLNASRTDLPAGVLSRFRDRYFDLGQRSREGLSPAEYRARLDAIAALAADLQHALPTR